MIWESKHECRPGQEMRMWSGWGSLEFLQLERQVESMWEIKLVKQSEASSWRIFCNMQRSVDLVL